jgi:4-amino-4-deoxy-L-arabinose transferase-like glycosyltransferase
MNLIKGVEAQQKSGAGFWMPKSEKDESPLYASNANNHHVIPWRMLTAILIVAFAVRFAWLVTQTNVIENEGAEYARIAQNLRGGVGYVGMMAGPQLLFPPLYPVLIAGLSFITGDVALAARLVNVLAGALLVLPAFVSAWAVHGRRAALIITLLITFHPLLVALSTSTYSECLYATLLFSELCFGLLWQQCKKSRDAILAGFFGGLAYLTRPEALAYPLVLMVVILISTVIRRENRKQALLQTVCMLICVAALASPYVAYLWRHTGQFRLEGKSEVNYAIGARLNSGLSRNQATWGISQNGDPEGPLLDPNRYLGSKPYPKHIAGMLQYLITSGRRNLWELRHLAAFAPLFWPLLATALFAFLPHTWSRERAQHEILPISFFVFVCLPLGIAPVFSVRRLLLPVIPLALLWSSKGIGEVSARAPSVFRKAENQSGRFKRIGSIIAAAAGLLVLFFAASSLQRFPELLSTRIDVAMKEAGLWLRQYDPGPKRVMDTGTIVSYYSGGTWLPMPSAGVPLSLKYIDKENPNYLVLNLAPWNTRALELRVQLDREPGAPFLREFGSGSSSNIRVYRWSPRSLSDVGGRGSGLHIVDLSSDLRGPNSIYLFRSVLLRNPGVHVNGALLWPMAGSENIMPIR